MDLFVPRKEILLEQLQSLPLEAYDSPDSQNIHYLDYVYISLFIPSQPTSWQGLQDMKHSTVHTELYKLGKFRLLRWLFFLEKKVMHSVKSKLITLKITDLQFLPIIILTMYI